MQRFLSVTICALFALAFIWSCAISTPALADTIKLTNGYEIYGQAAAHPVLKGRTLVTFSNGGNMTLKNTEIEHILPNDKDQFEMRKTERGEVPKG